MAWPEPSAAKRTVRTTRWKLGNIERARPFPETTLPMLQSEFDAIDLSAGGPLQKTHLLFLHRADTAPLDAGLVFWSSFSFFEVDAGSWTRNVRTPAISDAELMAWLDSLDGQPRCARDVTECQRAQTSCNTSDDGGMRCVTGMIVEPCLVDGGVFDGGE